MTTEFDHDQVFEELSAPEYPATCDQCGLEGTNATMAGHECDDSGQCEACDRIVPGDELRVGLPAAGVEGAFCTQCRGGESEAGMATVTIHSPLPWRAKHADTRFEILDAEGDPVLRINGGMIPTGEAAALMITATNNHASLVAALRDELEAIRVWQSARGVPAEIRDGLQISTEKIRAALSRVRE